MIDLKNALKSIPKAFVLFGRALRNAKKDFWISIQVLFWVSLGLSILFYIVEHAAQPYEYRNWWQAFVWTLTRYIGDPGHFAGKGPITLTGRHIDSFIGILKILIFAVPAGLVANGFRKAMEDERKEKHLQECRLKIQKSFRRRLTKSDREKKSPMYRVIPRRISPVTLQAKKGMTENDIIETVSSFDEFRLRNLAGSQTASEHPRDQLAIELLPLNESTVDGCKIDRTTYGVKINRQSNVTIVAPTAATENSIGHFAYYLAQFGCFNFISREFVTDVDEPVSYYKIEGKREDWEKPLADFVDDIKNISGSEEKWNVVLAAADNVHDTQVHLVHNTIEKCDVPMTTLDEEKLQKLFIELSETLKVNYELSTDLNEKYKPVGNKNIGVIAGGGSKNNAFTIRLSYSVITWSDDWLPIVVDIAKIIKRHLELSDRQQFVDNPSWKEKRKGYGFGDGEMSEAPKTYKQ